MNILVCHQLTFAKGSFLSQNQRSTWREKHFHLGAIETNIPKLSKSISDSSIGREIDDGENCNNDPMSKLLQTAQGEIQSKYFVHVEAMIGTIFNVETMKAVPLIVEIDRRNHRDRVGNELNE